MTSAVVAKWVKDNIDGEIIYYFNDVKWEHPDLYRFNNDIAKCFNIKITEDNDGRNPEQVFKDVRMLGSNRTPLCSKVLKAHMLQKFVKAGDTLYFGIDQNEKHRAKRIKDIYDLFDCKCIFPLIDNDISKKECFETIESLGIEKPQMYKDGFEHNNCHGGCVRAGKKQWKLLYRIYPSVYKERERAESDFQKFIGNDYTILKDISLKNLRILIDKQPELNFGNDGWTGECIGICGEP